MMDDEPMNNKQKIAQLRKCKNIGDFVNLPLLLQEELGHDSSQKNILAYIRELEREERDKDIIKIQESQTKMLDQQKDFTKILMLATVVLALSAFLQVILYITTNKTRFEEVHWVFGLMFIMGMIFFIAFIGGIITVIVSMIFKKKK